MLKKPSQDDRIAIEQCTDRTLKAVPAFLAGDMDKATMLVHTDKPPRPKPPRVLAEKPGPEGINS